jgi:nitroreductase
VTQDVLEVMATTRAIRRFDAEPIPEADLARMFFAATRAPSPSNRQNFRFLVLRQSDDAAAARTALGEEYRRRWAEKRHRDGYDAAARKAERPATARMMAAMEHFVDHFETIPVVVLACLIRYRDTGPLEGAAVYPACQNLLLAARALGYGGVLTQWHTGVEDELRKLLELPERVMIGGVVALGRPAGRHGPVRRLPLAELVFEGTWDSAPAWAIDPPGARFTRAGPPV